MSVNYEIGSIVWVKLGHKWWPGRVSSIDDCSIRYISSLKKEPLAVVRFFNESEFQDVSRPDHILPYNSSRKNDLIKKGLNAVKYEPTLKEKFEADVVMAEKLTGGNMDIIQELKEATKRRIDYSDLGFGTPKVKKHTMDECVQRRGFSNIGEAIQYKSREISIERKIIDYKVKIMEQPKQKAMEEEMKNASQWFKCYVCGFTCGRLNVIIWHNKGHLKKVEDYDSGIRIPGKRRRRKTKISKLKSKGAPKTEGEVNHSQTNGHVSPQGSQEASDLLLDWEDDDDDDQNEGESKGDQELTKSEADEQRPTVNGINEEEDESDECDGDGDDDDDYDDNEYPPPSRGRRQPMPKQDDINTAFDALLAESSPLHRNNNDSHNSSYVNNDSDSDSECSDWEKYYDSASEESTSNEQESDIKSLCEEETQNGHYSGTPKPSNDRKYSKQGSSSLDSTPSTPKASSSKSVNKIENEESLDVPSKKSFRDDKSNNSSPMPLEIRENCSPRPQSSNLKGPSEEAVESPPSPGPSVSKSASPVPERSREEQSEEHSTHSSNSSTSSGPAYMLVAVDAHGNNVPMPVLNEGGNHLVAVEASMEDGTTRTLYIDPAHLGPNVDLNNLMLHIDNSGQETVIIPTSTSDGEIISSTLVDQSTNEDEVLPPAKDDGPSMSTETSEASTESQEENKSSHLDNKEQSKSPKDEDKAPRKRKEENGRKKKDKKEKEPTLLSPSVMDDELPDLEMDAPTYEMFPPDEIVWVRTNNLWWPAYVVDVFPEENKVSVVLINSQQMDPIRIDIPRLKTFTGLDYADIFETQENETEELKEAMEIAEKYRALKKTKSIKEKPRNFFSLPVSEQRNIIMKQTFLSRGVPIEVEVPPSNELGSEQDAGRGRELDKSAPNSPRSSSEISEDTMSERDNIKLASAKKARKSSNEKFLRFLKSEACLEHLWKVCREEVLSARHRFFKENYWHENYLIETSGVYSSGLDFFGEDFSQQTDEIRLFLYKEFENYDFKFELDSFQRRLYINTVLYPEAIKQSLRHLTKIPEEELESSLDNGLYQTRTVQKAKRVPEL